MMDLCQVNLGAVSGGKTTVSTAETAATSKGKASTAETASSNGTRAQQVRVGRELNKERRKDLERLSAVDRLWIGF